MAMMRASHGFHWRTTDRPTEIPRRRLTREMPEEAEAPAPSRQMVAAEAAAGDAARAASAACSSAEASAAGPSTATFFACAGDARMTLHGHAVARGGCCVT